MSFRNGLSEVMRQRVEHAVMRVDGRESVLLQLISNYGNQLLHSFIIIGPVTNNLKKKKQLPV